MIPDRFEELIWIVATIIYYIVRWLKARREKQQAEHNAPTVERSYETETYDDAYDVETTYDDQPIYEPISDEEPTTFNPYEDDISPYNPSRYESFSDEEPLLKQLDSRTSESAFNFDTTTLPEGESPPHVVFHQFTFTATASPQAAPTPQKQTLASSPLPSSNTLRDAFLLNLILSKPVALRRTSKVLFKTI